MKNKFRTRCFQVSTLLGFSLLFLACQESRPQWDNLKYQQGKIYGTDKNIRVPRELALKIEEEYLKELEFSSGEEDSQSRAQKLSSVPREFLNLRVRMADPKGQVLSQPKEYLLTRGGGSIDLGQEFLNSKGQLWFRVEASHPELESSTPFHVYYLSRSRQKKRDGVVWGSGCGKVFELSHFFQETLQSEGVQSYITDGRHLSLFAGTYLIFAVKNATVFLTTLTFFDSQQREWTCSTDREEISN